MYLEDIEKTGKYESFKMETKARLIHISRKSLRL